MSTYVTAITAQPGWSSNLEALSTGAPQGFLNESEGPGGFLVETAFTETTPAWFTELPTEVQNYWVSIETEVSSIVDEVLTASPTGGAVKNTGGTVKAVGFVAAGLLGVAAWL
ncbi:MAG: hypothetical protein M1833_003277 [Piccolia ochrophora]|nr:MAG: hypothetical protein M1833_003277 [Piccolia ochrophora]